MAPQFTQSHFLFTQSDIIFMYFYWYLVVLVLYYGISFFFFLTGTIINFIMVFPICDLLQLHYYGIVHQWWLAASIVKEARQVGSRFCRLNEHYYCFTQFNVHQWCKKKKQFINGGWLPLMELPVKNKFTIQLSSLRV